MENYMGLYYPFMEFSSDAWIKLAALYWDKLGRIALGDHQPYDSATVKQLTDELGFVKSLHPTKKDRDIVGSMFLEVLDKHRETLRQYYGIHAQSSDDLPKEVTAPPLSEEEESILRLEFLQKLLQDNEHIFALQEKMTNLLYTRLTEEQLLAVTTDHELLDQVFAHEGDIQAQQKILEKHSSYSWFSSQIDKQIEDERQVRQSQIVYDGRLLYAPVATEDGKKIIIHPKLAFAYIEALADQMASTRHYHLVTDNVFSHVAISGYSVERLTQALLSSDNTEPRLMAPPHQSDEIEIQMAAIALQSVIPRNLADMPIQKIIRFRNQYRDEMIAFQEGINTLAKDFEQLQEIENFDEFKNHIENAYDRNFKPRLNDFRKSMKSLGMDTVMGAMSVQVAVPALLTSTITAFHLSPLNPIILGAGALACSIFPVIKKKREEAQQMVRSSPAAYLFYAQEQLTPGNVATLVAQQARKMLFSV